MPHYWFMKEFLGIYTVAKKVNKDMSNWLIKVDDLQYYAFLQVTLATVDQ